MTNKIGRRTFIAGCTVGVASAMIGTETARAAEETVDVTVTGKGEQVTKIEDFSSPETYESDLVDTSTGSLDYGAGFILDGYKSDVSDNGYYNYSTAYNDLSPQDVIDYYSNNIDGTVFSGDTIDSGGVYELGFDTLSTNDVEINTDEDVVLYHGSDTDLQVHNQEPLQSTGNVVLVVDGRIFVNDWTESSLDVSTVWIANTFEISGQVNTGTADGTLYVDDFIAQYDPDAQGSLVFDGSILATTNSAPTSVDSYVTYDSNVRDPVPLESSDGYWTRFYQTDASEVYDVSVPESISSELRITETPPDGTETTVSPGEAVTITTDQFYVRWDLGIGETIDEYSVEIDKRTKIDTISIAGQTETIGGPINPGEEISFTTSVDLDTAYDIDITELSGGSNPVVDLELQGTKIRDAAGAIVLEDGSPQLQGILYYAPNGESILKIPEVNDNNWKFELVAEQSEGESSNVTVDDLDLSEYVKRSELDSNSSDIELISEDEGGIPPSDGGGPLDRVGDFFRGIGRSISETFNNIRGRVT